MFTKVINTQGFWKSVFSIGLSFMILFVFVKWIIEGFKTSYFTSISNPMISLLGLFVAGFIYGFFVTYGKFQKKIKELESRK
ncbi:MAG: hypothetical protein ACWA45_01175 [Flavobacteriales bacterium]